MKKVILCLLIFKASIVGAQTVKLDSAFSQFSKKWIGTPYLFGGKTIRGIDCSQLNKRLYQDVYDRVIPDVCYKQFNASVRVNRDSLILGDLVFFRSKKSPSGWHCGCYVGNDLFLHAPARGERVKISSLDEPRYKTNYRGAGRFIF